MLLAINGPDLTLAWLPDWSQVDQTWSLVHGSAWQPDWSQVDQTWSMALPEFSLTARLEPGRADLEPGAPRVQPDCQTGVR